MKRKLNQSLMSKKKGKVIPGDDTTSGGPGHDFLSGVTCHIHPANFGRKRLNIFQSQVQNYGGNMIQTLPLSSETISYIIFEESVDVVKLKQFFNPSAYCNTRFVRCTWLVECVKKKTKVDSKDHEIISVVDPTDKHKNKEYSVSEGEAKQPSPEHHHPSNKDGLLVTQLGEQENPITKIHTTDISTKEFSPDNFSPHSASVKEIENNIIVPCDSQLTQQCFNEEQKTLLHSGEVKTEEENRIINRLEALNEIQTEHDASQETVVSLVKPFPKALKDKFACARPSSSKVRDMNHHITAELDKLAAAYKSKKDTWRALGYQKAISAIRHHPREITSREEALSIPGVGERLADKVAEIVESGKLRKVSEVCEGEEANTLKLFTGVWGAGPTTAQSWYTQGFRTLQDLQLKATLTRHQQIGLKHYDDINTRIPREEVAEIEDYVRYAALSLKKGLIVMVCGSYRRGKLNCGDVDVLITHPDGHSHQHLFKPLLSCLKETGFITDDLVTQEDNGNQLKYLGVCRLPGEGRKHRRLDVIIVPYAEFAPATMYFTGSAHFNRSMRLLAIKMGMSLSEHGLRAGIVRQGREKLTDGHLLETPTEQSIFEHLGLEYRPPHERDH
ncbi:DNA polymerase lambda-like [Homarus americanus]|uniref:DNA polymerase lambda-like n=1 Tax=Homarus americanus TaxID=6706 RepID=UPI001C44B8E3|nr:DNA polymerase lambda-like [Homarus americanus]